MNPDTISDHFIITDTMTDRIFRRFSQFIHTELGIKMPDIKKTMLQARLQKRMRKLRIQTYEEYYEYVFSIEGQKHELSNMIDVVTTNKTDFFRESEHFDFLTGTLLPEMLRKPYFHPEKVFMFWSAGCSTGEEPYTLAIILSDFAFRHPEFRFSILGTDISTQALKKASMGTYEHERVAPIPMPLRKKYLLRSKDKEKNLVRVTPELRNLVKFQWQNLLDNSLTVRESMDVIFFRNVMIYFDRNTQQIVLEHICRHLKTGGFLFVGHSETLTGLSLPLTPVKATVFRKIS